MSTRMMGPACLGAVLWLSAVCHAAEIMLEDFVAPQPSYVHALGGEFPGARATFSRTQQGRQSRGALKIDYDFTEGGRYCQWLYANWFPPEVRAISFHARGIRGSGTLVRIVDSSGQYFQSRSSLKTDDWERISLPLEAAGGLEHWGGANDGVLHQPLTQLLIGPVSHSAGHGSLLLDNVALETDMTLAEAAESRVGHFVRTARLKIASPQLSTLFSLSDEKRLELSVEAVPDGVADVSVNLQAHDAYGIRADILPQTVTLTPANAFSTTLELPSGLGYYDVSYTLTVRHGEQEHAAAAGSFSLAVVPDNPVPGKDPESPFGVNTHFNQGWSAQVAKLVKKAGIAWIRDGEASLEDRALPAAKQNGLCYLPCFTWHNPKAIAAKNDDVDWDDNFRQAAQWHRAYAEKYGADIDCYDLRNEPHGLWGAVFGGSWDGGPWQEVFARYGRLVAEAIKAGDPGARVVWEDITGLMWYRHFFDLGAADAIDIISPHPYSMHRNRPLPEEQAMLAQLPEFSAFVKRHDLPWEVWSGECGFGSFRLTDRTATPYYIPNTELQQAQNLVRMIVLQLSGGVSKIFWYDFRNDGAEPDNPEHTFGLIRNDSSPKPAVVAYAHLINRLRHCRPLGPCTIGGGADARAFSDRRTGKPVVIAWIRRGTQNEPLHVRSNVSEVTLTDIFGRAQVTSVTGRTLELALTETPMYIDGLAEADIAALLRPED